MHIKTHPKRTDLSRSVTLELSVDEAVALEALLGGARGNVARLLPWYDDIADALEADLLPSTISYHVEQRFERFEIAATFWDGEGDYKPDNSRQIEKGTGKFFPGLGD